MVGNVAIYFTRSSTWDEWTEELLAGAKAGETVPETQHLRPRNAGDTDNAHADRRGALGDWKHSPLPYVPATVSAMTGSDWAQGLSVDS